MVGKYNRKSTRKSWDEEAMQRAIDAVNNNEMGWLRAAREFGVPQATLRRRAQNTNKSVYGASKGLGRFKSTFNANLERELVAHLKTLESRLFGLNTTEVRKLAYQLAEENSMDHRFNRDKKMAGWDWLKGFRSRNADIGLRKPEPTSAARAIGFNRPRVKKFFEIYEETLKKYNISPTRIYNMDESALSTVHKPQKVLANKGKKQVGALTSAERGMHITVVCCMNTTGQYIPPALIFPRKNWKNELTDNAPMGTLGIAQETGWMTGDVFLKWLKHFADFAKPTVEDKVLLIVDGHSSHKQLDVLNYAKDNGIIMLCLPPHTTHRLQPLDVAFYGPLKTYFNQEVSKWLRNNPGRIVSQYQISSIFTPAYGKAATVANAESGFRNTGIWPTNPDIFEDYLFAPAETTNVSQNGLENTEQCEKRKSSDKGISSNPTINQSEDYNVSITDLSPIPSTSSVNNRQKNRKCHGSVVLTSSPFMSELEKKAEEKRQKELRKSTRNVKCRLNLVTEDVFEEELFQGADDDDNDCPCLYCNELFSLSKPGESWLQCMKCKSWAHSNCAGIPKNKKIYICELCK